MKAFTATRIEGGLMLGSRAAAAAYAHRHPNLVRRHCEPVACDVRTHAALYDLTAACDTLKALGRRVA